MGFSTGPLCVGRQIELTCSHNHNINIALDKLKHACNSQNAQHCYQNILELGRCLYQGKTIRSLADLKRQPLPKTLIKALDELDKALVDQNAHIDFQALYQQCHQLTQQQKKTNDNTLALYPAN